MSSMLQLEATSSLPAWASDPMLLILSVVIVGE